MIPAKTFTFLCISEVKLIELKLCWKISSSWGMFLSPKFLNHTNSSPWKLISKVLIIIYLHHLWNVRINIQEFGVKIDRNVLDSNLAWCYANENHYDSSGLATSYNYWRNPMLYIVKRNIFKNIWIRERGVSSLF